MGSCSSSQCTAKAVHGITVACTWTCSLPLISAMPASSKAAVMGEACRPSHDSTTLQGRSWVGPVLLPHWSTAWTQKVGTTSPLLSFTGAKGGGLAAALSSSSSSTYMYTATCLSNLKLPGVTLSLLTRQKTCCIYLQCYLL